MRAVPVLLVLATLPWALRRPAASSHAERGATDLPRARRPQRWPPALRPRPAPEPRVDMAVVLDVLDAALSAGASVPAALESLAYGLPVGQGRPMLRAAAALRLGAGWDQAWSGGDFPAVARALEPAWCDGVAPGPLLRQAAATVRARRAAASKEAAARLGVRLVLPLGLCLLPAFVLLGLVPLLLSTGGSLLGL